MKFKQSLIRLTLLSTLSLSTGAFAQGAPTATQQLQISAFAGGTANYTGLQGGKNADITAGADITLLRFRHFRPAAEIRGSYPIAEGDISSQKNFLVGPRVEYPLGRLSPYVDFLVGRGEINYLHGGFIFGDFRYIRSNTLVYSPGVGLDYRLTHNLAVKVDFQYQHWDTPVVPSGTIHPKATTLAAVYVFDFNPRHRHNR